MVCSCCPTPRPIKMGSIELYGGIDTAQITGKKLLPTSRLTVRGKIRMSLKTNRSLEKNNEIFVFAFEKMYDTFYDEARLINSVLQVVLFQESSFDFR